MKYIIKSLSDFFDPLEKVYVNPNEVVLTLMIDDICMSTPWPGFNYHHHIALEIVYNSGTISNFIKEMGITTAKEMDTITPSVLIDLYNLGRASVFCLIDQDPGVSMYFRKHNEKIRATDERDLTHTVQGRLKTPEDFINYVQEHYRLKQKEIKKRVISYS